MNNKEKEGQILGHDIFNDTKFYCADEDGNTLIISAQHHVLLWYLQIKDGNEWVDEGAFGQLDEFYLTGDGDGFRYSYDDIEKFFLLDDDDEIEFDEDSGQEENWCGIEEDDTYEASQKKWDEYKNKFPKVSSKDQFEPELD